LEAEHSDLPGGDLREQVLRDIFLDYIPKRDVWLKKNNMKQGLYVDLNKSIQPFVERLNDFNHYLLNFLKITQEVRLR
jgi:hypothetical protein